MRLFNYSKLCLGLLLSVLAYATPTLGYPKFVNEWAAEIKNIASSKNLKIDTTQKLEELLLSSINLDNFDVTCSALLQAVVKETSAGSETSFLNIDSALDICALINPWNSMECGGVTGVAASYARSIQEFIRMKDNTKGDLRAACVIASAISPGRPFAPITKGSIKSKCEEVCSGDLSKTISSIDASFCSLSMDLCGAVDFTLYNAFSSLNERELGIAVATSILLSEGSLGLRTSYREGCRFTLSLKQKDALPHVPSDVSESVILSNISEFYKSKLKESGLLLASGESSGSSETVFLKVLVSQIAKAMKTILEAPISKKPAAVKPKKPMATSTHITSSEVSPLSEASDDSLSPPEYKMSSRSVSGEAQTSDSPVLESWFYTIKQSIKKGTKDVDTDFDDSLNHAISRIDSSSVYSSCVSELKRLNLASHRRITEACRKIDPFSHLKCQKLNHFELMFMIKLREELEKYGKHLVVDLKDLCAIGPKLSLEHFLKNRNEELSDMCIKALQKKSFKSKYSVSDRVIKKACIKADYLRSSSCGNLVSNHHFERVNIVLLIANNLFDRRSEKERLQTVRDSESNVPSYADICNAVEKLPVETVEDCVFELRDSLSRFGLIKSIINIEDACISSLEGAYGFYSYGFGEYGSSIYPSYPSYSSYPGYPRGVEQKSLRRFYKDIQHAPHVSSLPWIRRDLPLRLQFPDGHVIEQEYSESRRGFYRDQNNKSVYHDGNRFKIGGNWFIKVGNNWFIDHSTALDFIKVLPNDPRYNPYPLSLYESSGQREQPLKRKSFATYLSPHAPVYPYGSYLQNMYGKFSTRVPGQQPYHYTRCAECYNWIPYGHDHNHEEPVQPKSHTISVKYPSEYDPFTGKYITRFSYYGDGGLEKTEQKSSQTPHPFPLPGNREVGVQTDLPSSSDSKDSGVTDDRTD